VEKVNATWTAVGVVGAATVAIKAAGPVVLKGRPLPERLGGMIELLAPVLLAALVVTQVFGGDRRIELDARAIGIAAAIIALLLRAHILVVVVCAAVAAALARGLS
jgi:branched-subunit amino acid transport protein